MFDNFFNSMWYSVSDEKRTWCLWISRNRLLIGWFLFGFNTSSKGEIIGIIDLLVDLFGVFTELFLLFVLFDEVRYIFLLEFIVFSE